MRRDLEREVKRCREELAEALRQQAATSEILRIISTSPTDLDRVLPAVAEHAARLCDGDVAQILRVEGDLLRVMASYGLIPSRLRGEAIRITRGSVVGRAVTNGQTVHVHDLSTELETEFPDAKPHAHLWRHRTVLATPLLGKDGPVGVIFVRRTRVQPFTTKQIALLKTFADQAVIAIENVRLFQELQARNRDLSEALEQQTATSEILRVISSSPTDLQPVLNAVAESATRLCQAADCSIFRLEGELERCVAIYGSLPEPLGLGETRPVDRESVVSRAMLDRVTMHVPDIADPSDTRFAASKARAARIGYRTILVTPLLREGEPIGAIAIRRTEVRPFTEEQIRLLETFADQAVIAIENVRLFQELQARTRDLTRSVEELKALGEVGQAVSSTLDVETVLTTIVARAVQLSGTDAGVIYEYDEATETFQFRATYHMEEELVEVNRSAPIRLGEGATGQAAATRTPVQVTDLLEEREYSVTRIRPVLARLGYRSLLAVPLLVEQRLMGALTVVRRQAGNFAPEVVNLLQTFATQSVLAIQNARLFREIADKSQQLEAASQHKSEFLANMSHELRTPLNAIIGFSEVLLERMFGEVNEKQTEYLQDILSSGQHLLSLINDILDLSKVEAGRMELALAPFDLPQALENAVTLVKERAARHGIALDRKTDPRLGELVGDERKIKQVLLNLLSNAVKFTPERGQITLKAVFADGSVEISVSDTGIGIAPEDQGAIFEEFRQVGGDDARKREGTGLGLTLAKKFIEMHGGRIWVESEVGRGSTFTFTLPLRA